MGDNRTPEELAGGFITCRIGGTLRNVPTLKLKDERDWRLMLAQAVGEAQVDVDWKKLKEGGEEAYAALVPLTNLPTDIALKLISAYDKTAKLGGDTWLEENADSAQLYQTLLAMARVVFPFVNDLRSAVMEILQLMRAAGRLPSDSSSSTNGHLPTGDSTPTDSKEPLTPVS